MKMSDHLTRLLVLCCFMVLELVLISAAKVDTGCQGEFQEKCHCGKGLYKNVSRFITNCTNTGFTNVSMLQQLPIETEVLIFTGNDIRSLPPNLFGNETTYQNLTDIDLSNNNISIIQGKAFHRIPNVRRLILNNNRWRVDKHRRMFVNMDKLEELHLNAALDIGALDYTDPTDPSYNSSIRKLLYFFEENPMESLREIHLESNRIGPYLHVNLFSSLPNLERIHLANNSILQVHWTESSSLSHLQYLDLSFNHIPFLFNDTMEWLDNLEDVKVNLSGNSFDCDCNMISFHQWLHETHVFIVDRKTYTCQDGYPEENAGQLIMNLPSSVLQCQKLFIARPNLGIAQIVIIMILVLMCSLLSVVAFVNRRMIMFTVRRYGEPLYRRMQYSTIQKQAAENEIEI